MHPVSLTLRAERAMAREQWGRSFDLSNEALRRRADLAPAFFVRAMSRIHLDDHRGALGDFHRYLALAEQPPPAAYFLRGWLYAHLGEWAMAYADLERALHGLPRDPQVHAWRAYALYERGEWERAHKALAAMESAGLDHPLAWELRGHLHFQAESYAAADDAYQRALAAGRDSAPLRANVAALCRHLGRGQQARRALDTLVTLYPDDPHTLLELSHCAADAEQWEEALRHARAALAVEPRNVQARWAEVVALWALDDALALAERLDSLEAILPGDPHIAMIRGDLLSRFEEPAAALRCYERARSALPDYEPLRLKIVREQMALEAYDCVEEELQALLASDPACSEALSYLCDVYRFTNRPEQMARSLARLLELQPNDAWALTYRAAYHFWKGALVPAQRDLDTALASDDTQAWIWAFRGELHSARYRLEAAFVDYRRALALEPDDPWIRRNWAELLLRAGQCAHAAEVLDALLDDDPADGYSRMVRVDLYLLAHEWDEARSHLERVVQEEHELAWLAHAALAALSRPDARGPHLQQAERLRPLPTFWGVDEALLGLQAALLAWLNGEAESALAMARAALSARVAQEALWYGFVPLCERVGADVLAALVRAAELPAPLEATG